MTKLAFHFMFEIVVRWAGKLVRVGEMERVGARRGLLQRAQAQARRKRKAEVPHLEIKRCGRDNV